MAKITLSDIASELPSNKPYNNNNASIEAEFQNKVLYRDNPEGEPNAMQNALDMNNNDILNVGSITIGGYQFVATGDLSLVGGVNSVSMTVPTGLSVTGSPILAGTDGTLAVSLTAGYTIPLDTDIANWNTAYGWGDHSVAGYLTSVTAANVNTEAATDGWVLTSDGLGNAAWEALPPAVTDLVSLTDVTITTPTNGEVLQYNGSIWVNGTVSGGLSDVVSDTTPQLGGNLDVNGFDIVSTTNADIDIIPNGTGNVKLGTLVFDADQVVGVGTDNYVLTYDNGTGFISLEAAAGGGGGIGAYVDTNSVAISDNNTALAAAAGANHCIGIAQGALNSDTTGDYNVGLGYYAGNRITTGAHNFTSGFGAGQAITTGNDNIAIGQNSLTSGTGTTCSNNVALGREALEAVTIGNNNVGIGPQAGTAITSGTSNVAIGELALATQTTVNECTAVGVAAGWTNTGANNTFLGYFAGATSTSGTNNIVIGSTASKSSPTVSNEITLGNASITSLRIPGLQATAANGDVLTFDGSKITLAAPAGGGGGAFSYKNTSNLVASDDNTAGASLTTGTVNFFALRNAGLSCATGLYNVGIGNGALQSTTGTGHIGIGRNAGANITSDNYDVCIGYNTGINLGVGTFGCVAIGANALGSSANRTNIQTTVAIGQDALTFAASSSKENTAIGYGAGTTLSGTSASNNTIIGYSAQPSSATASNEFTFGNSSVKAYRFPGTTTVASLPAAATVGAGTRAFVTDANATTFASVVAGGGANGVPVYSDGTNWRIG